MSQTGKDINLLSALEGRKKKALQLPLLIGIGCTCLLLGLAGAVAFGFISIINGMSAERDELQGYVYGEQTLSAYNEAVAAKAAAQEALARTETMKQALQALSSYPALYQEDYALVVSLTGDVIDLTDFNFDPLTGILSFEASAEAIDSVPYFIEMMRGCGRFSDVQYRGYARTEQTIVPLSSSSSDDGTSSSESYEDYSYTIVGYSYSVQCLVAAPEPTLPAMPQSEQPEAVTPSLPAPDAGATETEGA